MALFTAKNLSRPPVTGGQAGVVVCNEGEYSLPDSLAQGDIIKLTHLPAGHKPVDSILEADDLDDATALVLSVGIVNDDGDDLVASTNLIDSSTVGQAGGVARADTVAGLQLAASTSDRVIGAKVVTAAGTPAAGKLRLKLLSVPA